MTVLYLDRKTLRITREGRAIVLRDGEQRLTSIPMRLLERVVIQGNAQIDAFIFHHLAREQIPVVIIGRGSGRIALVQGGMGANAKRRFAQYRLYADNTWRTQWSKTVVRHKIVAQLRLLRQMQRERADLRKPFNEAIGRIVNASDKLRGQGDFSVETLRGMEGAAASAFFHAYTKAFPPALAFTHRNRRPPKDPVNVALSLGYTLLHAELVIGCHQQGLDPYIGFLHDLDHGRESLASDLMDPLRPLVDAWVWDLFRKQHLRNRNFYTEGEACRLDKDGRALFYKQWEVLARPLRRRVRRIMVVVIKAMAKQSEGAQ